MVPMHTRYGPTIEVTDPDLCRGCRFARPNLAQRPGSDDPVFFCRRLDCDNWEHVAAPQSRPWESLVALLVLGLTATLAWFVYLAVCGSVLPQATPPAP